MSDGRTLRFATVGRQRVRLGRLRVRDDEVEMRWLSWRGPHREVRPLSRLVAVDYMGKVEASRARLSLRFEGETLQFAGLDKAKARRTASLLGRQISVEG